MSILHFFQRKLPLPTPQQTGIGERATKEANAAIQKEISADSAGHGTSRKRKKYTSFTDNDRVMIGKYAAENGNISAQKNSKLAFPTLVKVPCTSSKRSIWRL